MKFPFTIIFFIVIFQSSDSLAQLNIDGIKSDFVLRQRRISFEKYMREKTINETFNSSLDSTTEYKFETALNACTQFILFSGTIQFGVEKLLHSYESLEYSTKCALLEYIFTVKSIDYTAEIQALLLNEHNPKLFAMQALYILDDNYTEQNINTFMQIMRSRFAGYDSITLLSELAKHVSIKHQNIITRPSLKALIHHQQTHGYKVIYSFQRWNRNYPGIAIIQLEDGSFAKDSNFKIIQIGQLARSASGLPYFITNGNTPQGVYSIQGIDTSYNQIIGPTPNIQLLLPFENDSLYWHMQYDSTLPAIENYKRLFPLSWANYTPMQEAYFAGLTGRSAIIAHGSTIDPEYFSDKPFYPFSPTLGCLSAKEVWNINNGKLLESEQFKLANTYSCGKLQGFLYVINIDDKHEPVTEQDVLGLLNEN